MYLKKFIWLDGKRMRLFHDDSLKAKLYFIAIDAWGIKFLTLETKQLRTQLIRWISVAMRPFSKKLFNAVIVIVSLFCLVKCSESNEKSLLSSKLQSAVSKLSEIVTRLDPSSGLAKIPLPSKPSVSVVESAAKRRPPGKINLFSRGLKLTK